MKNLFFTLMLLVGLTVSAQQNQRNERQPGTELTAEQRNELQLKKMTLALDLNASQQKEMKAIIAEQTQKREAMKAERKTLSAEKKQLTEEERFARKNKMLDEQIGMKAKMKKILNVEQYQKWEEMKAKRHDKAKKHQGKRKEMGAKRGIEQK